MAGPWENVQLPAPPSLVVPKADFSTLGDLGNAYYKGQEQQQQQAIRKAFSGGLPRTDPNDPNSAVDYAAAANRLFQLGDYAGGTQLLNFAGGQKALEAAGGVKSPYDTGGAVPGGGGAASGPMQPQQVAPQQQQPTGPQAPTENLTGPNTETTVGPAQPPPQRPTIQSVPPARMFQAAQAPPAAVAAAAAMVPPADRPNPLGFVQRANEAADRIDNAIAAGKIYGKDLGAMQKKAEGYRADAAKVLDALAPTGPMKEAATSGATNLLEYDKRKARELDIQKLAVDNSEKQYQGIRAGADQYQKDQKPYLALSKNILNDPAMYTGIGASRVLDWNRIKAAVGDTKAAALQEMLQKVTATSALAQVNLQRDQMQEAAGPNGGRIFSQQVDLVNKSIPQLEGTLQGNRALVEIQSRMGERAVDIHKLAVDYRRAHGYLDDGFQERVAKYLDGHPLLNKQEMANPALLGAPTSPFTDYRPGGQVSAWAQKMGLRPDEAIRSPNGKLVHVPAFTAEGR